MRSWMETVTFLFLLVSLLCIESEGFGSQNKHNLKVERDEYRMRSANAKGSEDNSSSHDAIFGGKIGYNVVSYSAIYELAGNGAYFGGGGRFDIYGYRNLTADEIVTTAVWIIGVNDANVEVIQAGWHADGYIGTGCYNILCEGFVKVEAPLSPGDALPISTPDELHDLRIWIEKDHTGDWWLYASTDSTSGGQIGYWPKLLFSRLARNATDINFGGLVQAIQGSPSPPMGSGRLPNEGSAAYFANVEYVDQFGRKIAGILPSVVTNKTCYDVGDMRDAQFIYGGPGGLC